MSDVTRTDVIVIGAGIAGASAADALAADCNVVLLEREPQPGYHTTGRSAALFAPVYGPAADPGADARFRSLYVRPAGGLCRQPDFVAARCPVHRAGRPAVRDAGPARRITRRGQFRRAGRGRDPRLQPLVSEGYAAAGLYNVNCEDIDVATLHQGFLRRARARGCTTVTNAEVLSLEQLGDGWRVHTTAGPFEAPRVVNAAGAWADALGQMAGAEPIGLIPKRRTAMQIAAPDGTEVGGMPIVVDVQEEFYVKPVAGQLLLSPANEDHDVPSDVQPDELDIAICVDRVERAFDFRVGRIETRWAGLRSFVADKCPVAGYSAEVPGFFWLRGAGGLRHSDFARAGGAGRSAGAGQAAAAGHGR